jgi:carbamoyl-phosphate synthase large subunit
LEIANDKGKLYQFLQWRGIEVPDFRVVETVDQFMTAAGELNYPGNPICFKPSVSNGSRGFRILANNIDEHHLLFNEKPNLLIFLIMTLPGSFLPDPSRNY